MFEFDMDPKKSYTRFENIVDPDEKNLQTDEHSSLL